jgi:hypothetical protein
MTAPTDPPPEVALTIRLLDSAQGFPIQTWHFPARPEVRIGRAPDNDVVITHPYVSRYHVRLVWREGDWEMVNLGTHGTLMDGRPVSQVILVEGDEMRLGPLGPTLRFQAQKSNSGLTPNFGGTLAGDLSAAPAIRIDAAKKEEEVGTIVGSDYFRELQARLQALRARKK